MGPLEAETTAAPRSFTVVVQFLTDADTHPNLVTPFAIEGEVRSWLEDLHAEVLLLEVAEDK